jgi:hypothetical protein
MKGIKRDDLSLCIKSKRTWTYKRAYKQFLMNTYSLLAWGSTCAYPVGTVQTP